MNDIGYDEYAIDSDRSETQDRNALKVQSHTLDAVDQKLSRKRPSNHTEDQKRFHNALKTNIKDSIFGKW